MAHPVGPSVKGGMKAAPALAHRIAQRLGQIEGVQAVVLGGSWARGTAQADSDLDIGIYYDPQQPPAIEALRRLAQELDDHQRGDAVTNYGGWGPWINGGAWLEIEGWRVDWIYRDLEQVQTHIAACRAGRTACHYQPGHPHGFHTHIYMGEVRYCRPLYDPQQMLARLRRRTAAYPPALKRAIIDHFLWEAEFALDTAGTAADRGDVFYVAGCLFRAVAALVQVLFALNERYFVNEKGAVAAIETFPRRPYGFSETASALLARPGEQPASLRHSLERMGALVRATRVLAAG